MLSPDDLADAEGSALAMLQIAKLDPSCVPSMATLARRLTGAAPQRARMVGLGDLTHFREEWILRVNRALPTSRANWVVGHELGHWWFRTHQREPTEPAVLEAMCDVIGAALVVPREAFRAARAHLGDRVHRLAETFETTHALALLRVGEVTGRPVRLLGPRERVRGDHFIWGDTAACLRGAVRDVVHPVRLADEGRWGLMAA